MLDYIRKLLRISSDDFDEEIQELIDAAESDLELVGIMQAKFSRTGDLYDDILVRRAIATYAKANFGADNPDTEKLMTAYVSLKERMAMAQGYMHYVVTFNTTEQQSVLFDGKTAETNASGTVEFTSRGGNHLEYRTLSGTDYVDVTGDVTVEVL